MAKLKVGAKAPDFTLPDNDGKQVKLSGFKGRKVVIYFYPKDDTPGCTKEACAFRNTQVKFNEANAVILGVSPDGRESHQKFRAKYNLPFILLSDPDHKVSELYKVWKKKQLYGRSFMGIERSTFIIDEQGKLLKEMREITVDGHADIVLKFIVT